MKIDKQGKRMAGTVSFILWSMFLLGWGGIYPIWTQTAQREGQLLGVGFVFVSCLFFSALAYLTELKE